MKRSKLKFEVADDGSIIGKGGKILFFSLERFKKDIVEGGCCFICGCSRGSRKFNDEHVIPDWLLREFNLHNHQIGLPNSFGLQYAKYKIPCCVSCNLHLGETLETPVSKLFKSGYASVLKHIKQHGVWLFYLWLCLVYFKTHFKDRTLRFAIDKRKNEGAIGDRYDWNTMHHIHCVIRSVFTHVPLDSKIIGSFFLFPAKQAAHFEPYDYSDLFFAKTIFVRFKEIAMFCVLDDACATYTSMKDGPMKNIAGPMSPIQLRELMARISYEAILVSTKPKFFTEIKDGYPAISAQIPDFVETEEGDDEKFGIILHHLCRESLKGYQIENKDVILGNMKRGRWTFLFDEGGKFQKDSMI
jgi:hypothetical protein